MEQYVSKSALVTEIERILSAFENSDAPVDRLRASILIRLLSFIDTLEAKEVDLEKEINEWQGCEAFPEGVGITPLPKAMEIVERTARHFFELGLKAMKEE